MHKALKLSAHINLSALSYFLYQQGVPHSISEESGQQVVWTADAESGEQVRQIYEQWQSGQLVLEQPPRRGFEIGKALKSIPWKQFPLTLLILVACLLVGLWTRLGSDIHTVLLLSFVQFKVHASYISFSPLAHTLALHEYWRLITPIFLHFSMMHLAFNAVMLYVLGRQVEGRQGWLHLLGLVLMSGILSNFAQYYASEGTSLFGGLSGVVYALMGYGMVRERIDHSFSMGVPKAIYGFMIFWLMIGYTDILSSVVGHMANAAHLAGLLSGVLLGALAGLMFRQRAGE